MVAADSFIVDTMAEGGSPQSQFGYDATESRGRRRPPESKVKHEDQHTKGRKRQTLSASSQDLARNFELAAWAIRKHLDYVSSFRFQAKTKDPEFNDVLEAAVKKFGSKSRFEVSGKHTRRRATRIAEACRVKDGDILWLKIAGNKNRGRIQGIEAYHLDINKADVPKGEEDSWVDGVKVDKFGKHLKYSITDFDKNGRKKNQKTVPARNCIYHGYFDRFDQTRGLSPFVTALNRFRDTYEGFEYALAKVKLGQLFGLEVYRDTSDPLEPWSANESEETGEDTGYEFDLSGPGPFIADMEHGDRVGILESKTPSTETVAFLVLAIQMAIKSLDIPFSFFDESFTNFYGSRGGLIQYLKSCLSKIEDLQEMLDEWTRWRVGMAIFDGELELPAGMEFEEIQWEWVPDGVPWWDPVKEARGAAMSIAMGVSSPQRECRLAGTDFYKNIDETAVAIAYAQSKEVPLTFADSTAFAPEITTGNID